MQAEEGAQGSRIVVGDDDRSDVEMVRLERLPAIVPTGEARPAVATRAWAAGARGALVKPSTYDELLTIVAERLQGDQ